VQCNGKKLACVGDICLKENGESCTADQHCVSSFCPASKKCRDRPVDTQPGDPCLAPASACTDGLVCKNGRCLIPNGEICSGNKFCKSGICLNRKCRDRIDCHSGVCPSGRMCIGGHCVLRKCTGRNRCPTGYSCQNRGCRKRSSNDSCLKASSCRRHEENCINGRCQVADWCQSNADCKGFYQCKSGLCRPRPMFLRRETLRELFRKKGRPFSP
jgi:hypothetical protein